MFLWTCSGQCFLSAVSELDLYCIPRGESTPGSWQSRVGLFMFCSQNKQGVRNWPMRLYCNEGLSPNVPSLGMVFGGLGHVPYMLILLGVATCYQHLSKLRYFLPGSTHGCVQLQNLFYLAARKNSNWKFWQSDDHELRGFKTCFVFR